MRFLLVFMVITFLGIASTVIGGMSGNKTFWQFLDLLQVRYILLLCALIIALYILISIYFHYIHPTYRRFVLSAYSGFMFVAMTISIAALVSPPLKSFVAKADGKIGANEAIADGKTEVSVTTSQVDAATAEVGVHAIGTIGILSVLFCLMYCYAGILDSGRHPFTFARLR